MPTAPPTPPEPNPEADARAAIDQEFCRQHADDDGHALIWDADGPYCMVCRQVTPRNQKPPPEPGQEPELEAG